MLCEPMPSTTSSRISATAKISSFGTLAAFLSLMSFFTAAVVAPQTALAQQGGVEVGTLTCTGGAGVGLILGSNKSYRCTFSNVNGAPLEDYTATVTKIGLDIGVTNEATIIWTVFAASNQVSPGALSGNYGGASADVSVGIGGGANVLVGGSSNTIFLQPLSVQGQTGLNLAVGIAGMTLR